MAESERVSSIHAIDEPLAKSSRVVLAVARR